MQIIPKTWPLLVLLLLFILTAWAPWMTRGAAEAQAVDSFTERWDGVVDGCGFNCVGCGVTGSRQVLFGWMVRLEYACGLIPQDTPEYHQQEEDFVSLFGTVHEK